MIDKNAIRFAFYKIQIDRNLKQDSAEETLSMA